MTKLARLLLKWYARHARILPWRNHPDPYAVWVSEIMLQQTRVETVISYFEKWMKLFPSIEALAKSPEDKALSAWEGLGYYTRARNLHKAAKIVSQKFNGTLPRDLKELRNLPGIGRYTVGAIASMSFGMDEPTLDGNLRRVFSRLYDVSEFVDSSAGEKILWELAAQNLPQGRAGDYNQALMDLGSMICTPKKPDCQVCPLRALCASYKNGTQDLRPLLKPKKKIPHRLFVAAVIIQRGKVLLSKRPASGLLGGLWEFPAAQIESNPQQELSEAIFSVYKIKVKPIKSLGIVKHTYSHFKATVHVFECEARTPLKISDNLREFRVANLVKQPMGKIDRQITNWLA